jgi:hypothetical protein
MMHWIVLATDGRHIAPNGNEFDSYQMVEVIEADNAEHAIMLAILENIDVEQGDYRDFMAFPLVHNIPVMKRLAKKGDKL